MWTWGMALIDGRAYQAVKRYALPGVVSLGAITFCVLWLRSCPPPVPVKTETETAVAVRTVQSLHVKGHATLEVIPAASASPDLDSLFPKTGNRLLLLVRGDEIKWSASTEGEAKTKNLTTPSCVRVNRIVWGLGPTFSLSRPVVPGVQAAIGYAEGRTALVLTGEVYSADLRQFDQYRFRVGLLLQP